MKRRTYIAIDLKSFYASVECRERGFDLLDTAASEGSECRTAARRTGTQTGRHIALLLGAASKPVSGD